MKCPKCGKNRCKYVKSRKINWKRKDMKSKEPRTDFNAKCKDCGFEGIVK